MFKHNSRKIFSLLLGISMGLPGLALAAGAERVYVAGDATDNVVVIDAHTNSVITNISTGLGTAPHNLVATPDGNSVWVTYKDSQQVARINTQTNSVEATYSTGGYAPVHLDISNDGNWLYVNNKASDEIIKMNTSTGNIVARYTFGGAPGLNYNPHDINLSPDGTQLWVTDEQNGVVSILDTDLTGVSGNITVGNRPIQLAFSPDNSTAYVSNYDDNTVSVIDVLSQTVSDTFAMGGSGNMGPMGAVISPDGTTLWLSGTAGNTIHGHSLIDGGAYGYIESSEPLTQAHGLDISDNGDFLYTSVFFDGSSTSRDAIAVIDAATGAVVDKFYTPGASGLHGVAYVSAVPIPAAIWFFGSGIIALFHFGRKKRV